MNISIRTDDFFPGIPSEYNLFESEEPVWTGLNHLKEFLRDTLRPNLPENIKPGVPVDRHVAMIDGEWTTGGFQVVCSSETKGRFRVMADGRLISDAVLICSGAVFAGTDVELQAGVIVEPGALVKGPSVIGQRTEIRQGAYMRGDCFIGAGCVVGHTTEVKHSIFLDNAKAGHFAYVGDSILGRDVNMGAGTKLANLRFGPGSVAVLINGERVDTGRRKLGAILGDGVQTGCNSVTNPGSIVGPGSLIAPNTTVAPGVYMSRSVIR